MAASLEIGEATAASPLVAKDAPETITDARLRKYNLIACVLHFVQGTLMLVASQQVKSIKDFSKTVTTSFLVFNETTRALEPGNKTVGQIEIGVCAAVFLLMSALAHLIVLAKFDWYLAELANGINRLRWYEYAASSSLMIVAIATLFGVYDLSSLILIFSINANMNFWGLIMEQMNPPNRRKVNWDPFIFGTFAGAIPWVVVFVYFFGGGNFGQIPGFVYGILFGYLLFFNTFPINMILQYAKVGRWAEYRFGELVYIILSLLSKSLLAWLVFGGTFQPNGDDN